MCTRGAFNFHTWELLRLYWADLISTTLIRQQKVALSKPRQEKGKHCRFRVWPVKSKMVHIDLCTFGGQRANLSYGCEGGFESKFAAMQWKALPICGSNQKSSPAAFHQHQPPLYRHPASPPLPHNVAVNSPFEYSLPSIRPSSPPWTTRATRVRMSLSMILEVLSRWA